MPKPAEERWTIEICAECKRRLGSPGEPHGHGCETGISRTVEVVPSSLLIQAIAERDEARALGFKREDREMLLIELNEIQRQRDKLAEDLELAQRVIRKIATIIGKGGNSQAGRLEDAGAEVHGYLRALSTEEDS